MYFELKFLKGGESRCAYAHIDESINTIVQNIVEDFVCVMNTEDMEMLVDNLTIGTNNIHVLGPDWADLHEQNIVEQMIVSGIWTEDTLIKEIFSDNEANEAIWSIEIDLDNEYVRFYNQGTFISSIDFVELDEMDGKTLHEKCEEIATSAAAAVMTKLTMNECRSIKSSMKQQKDVLEKLFKAINEGREHARLLEGVSEDEVNFAEQYCQDMINAANTLSLIAGNAEKILKPIEDAKKKAEAAKRKAKQDLETDAEGEEKPKKRKKRSPRKKKTAPVKIAQTETADDIAEVVEEVAEDGED